MKLLIRELHSVVVILDQVIVVLLEVELCVRPHDSFCQQLITHLNGSFFDYIIYFSGSFAIIPFLI